MPQFNLWCESSGKVELFHDDFANSLWSEKVDSLIGFLCWRQMQCQRLSLFTSLELCVLLWMVAASLVLGVLLQLVAASLELCVLLWMVAASLELCVLLLMVAASLELGVILQMVAASLELCVLLQMVAVLCPSCRGMLFMNTGRAWGAAYESIHYPHISTSTVQLCLWVSPNFLL